MATLYRSNRALIHNLFVCQKFSKSRILAMLPDNAFGQDIKWVVQQIHQGVQGYGVNSIRDYISISTCPKWIANPLPIFLFTEDLTEQDMLVPITNSAVFVISSMAYFYTLVDVINKWRLRRAKVWLHLTNGYTGLTVNDAKYILDHSKTVSSTMSVLGTCSNSDYDTVYTQQLQELDPNNTLDTCLHSSKGILDSKNQSFSWVRPGRLLLGSTLVASHALGHDLGLKPAIQLVANVIHTQTFDSGQKLYDRTFTKPTKIATLDVGMIHGLSPTNQNLFFYHTVSQRTIKTLGSFNTLRSDITYVEQQDQKQDIQVGDEVVVFGHVKADTDFLQYKTGYSSRNTLTIAGNSNLTKQVRPYLPY
jgi:alanine racemase